jgi:hypothetical protein
MRIIKKLAVFSIASLITFGLGVMVHRFGSAATRYFSEPSAWQVLRSFENQDLGMLDEKSLHAVRDAIGKLTGPGRPPHYMQFEPRLFRRIANSNGEQRYMLVEQLPMWMIPGAETIRVNIFDSAGKLLSTTEFDTGNRMGIIGMRIRTDYWVVPDALTIDCEFWLGGNSSHQAYTIVGNELRLIYLGDGLKIDNNNYHTPWMTIGPRLNLSADEWERELQSTDNARVLSALIWLGGYHWDGQAPPYDEDRPDAEKVTNLRGRESVRRRLADLTKSPNYYIRVVAEATVKDK